MIAASRQEQLDIEAVLSVMEELADLTVVSEFRGVTENELDRLLDGAAVKSPKLPGAILLVTQPEEQPHDKADIVLVDARTHMVRIIEQVKVNRKPGWEGDTAKLACGMTADEIKDLVKQALHLRKISGGTLTHGGTEPYGDTKGGYGWDVKFRIAGQLGTEARASTPRITQSAPSEEVTAAPATFVITVSQSGETGSCTLTVNGAAQGFTFGASGNDVENQGDEGEFAASVVASAFAAKITELCSEAAATASGPDVTVTTTGTGENKTLGFNRNDLIDTFTNPPVPATGVDGITGGIVTVTLTGTGTLRYTTDGTTPIPGGDTVTTYSVPFAASSGTLVRASAIATGKALSDFTQTLIA